MQHALQTIGFKCYIVLLHILIAFSPVSLFSYTEDELVRNCIWGLTTETGNKMTNKTEVYFSLKYRQSGG